MRVWFIFTLIFCCLVLSGCHGTDTTSGNLSPSFLTPPEKAQAASKSFLSQKVFDPWKLSTSLNSTASGLIPVYLSDGKTAKQIQIGQDNLKILHYKAGNYVKGLLFPTSESSVKIPALQNDSAELNLQSGLFQIISPMGKCVWQDQELQQHDWPKLWSQEDISIADDPESQQVSHANLFYLLSSTYPGSKHSIPPMGLSSSDYSGHIFWDADIWMFPALIAQYPLYAKSMVDYRYKLLQQAIQNAKLHHRKGAEYPWESAATGKEEAPQGFSLERHITADVAWAAWQYYLWSGDSAYLKKEGWPILKATADYWVSRVSMGKDDKYHVKNVLSPDETTGPVDDDAYTNAAAAMNLQDALRAAKIVGEPADPSWNKIAKSMYIPYSNAYQIPAENNQPLTNNFMAKQADTLLLLYPLNFSFSATTQQKMLDYYSAHTMTNGPAMTSSIEAVVAARLGHTQQAYNLFQDSYQPFERGPWDAFSEKRTMNRVYFLTGMGGSLQSILYGFTGLRVVPTGEAPVGKKIAGDALASLYAKPCLPAQWNQLTIKGIHFHGQILNLTVLPGNKVVVTQ